MTVSMLNQVLGKKERWRQASRQLEQGQGTVLQCLVKQTEPARECSLAGIPHQSHGEVLDVQLRRRVVSNRYGDVGGAKGSMNSVFCALASPRAYLATAFVIYDEERGSHSFIDLVSRMMYDVAFRRCSGVLLL